MARGRRGAEGYFCVETGVEYPAEESRAFGQCLGWAETTLEGCEATHRDSSGMTGWAIEIRYARLDCRDFPLCGRGEDPLTYR